MARYDDSPADGGKFVDVYHGQGAAAPAVARLVFVDQGQSEAAQGPAAGDPMKYLNALLARKWTVLIFSLVGLAAGTIAHLRQTPTYVARTMLELNAPNESSLVGGPQLEETGTPDSLMQTQIRIIQSSVVRERVNDKLKMQGIPAFKAVEQMGWLRSVLGIRTPSGETKGDLPKATVSVRPLERSQIIEILCESPNPNMAALYPNTLAEEYIDYHIEVRGLAAERASKVLNKQLSEMRARLQESENRLQAYKQQTGLLYGGGDRTRFEEDKLRQLQAELSKAEADRIARQSAYETAKSAAADTVPEILDNGRLNGYQAELARLRREQAELMATYTKDHPRVVRLQAQISELDGTQKREREQIVSRIRNEYQSAERRQQLLRGEYAKQAELVTDLSRKEVSFDLLRRDLEGNRRLYDDLLQKSTGTAMLAAVKVSSAYVIDRARVPESPSKPSLKMDLVMGLTGGMLLGVLLVLGSDQVNRRLRSPGDTPMHLRVPELGVIPDGDSRAEQAKVSDGAPVLALAPGHTGGSENGDGAAGQTGSADLVLWQNKPSLLAESFRSTVASILMAESRTGRRPRVIIVTSASRGEGKSSTVSNLGVALAEIGQRVLLIDADLRKPDLHKVFGTPNSWGLSDLPTDPARIRSMPLEALVRPTDVKGLSLMPSGPGLVNIASLLHSSRMKELLDRFRREFDTILIDTPPLLYLSDARVLGSLADGAILVVRAGVTTRDSALAAKKRLVEDGINIIGSVLNRWSVKAKKRDAYYGYPEQ